MPSRGLSASLFLMLTVAALHEPVWLGRAVAAETAQLRAHTGDVQLRRANKGPIGPAPAVVTPLGRRDEIETHSGTATVELPSGMMLELGPSTLLAVIGGGIAVDGFLARGTLAVGAGGAPEVRLIQIATPVGRVDVRAREARLDANAERVLVQVVNGTAEVVSKQQKVAVASGQEVEVRPGGIVGTPRPLAGSHPPGPVPTPPTPAPVEPPVAMTPAPTPPPMASYTPEVSPPPAPTPPAVAVAPTPAPVVAPVVAPTTPAPIVTSLPAPPAAPAKKESFIGFTTLKLLREKNIISQAEFDSALRDLHETVGPRGAESLTLVLGRFATTLYGFVQADAIWNSTQSFNDFGSNFAVARPGTLAGDNPRFEGSIRDSRIGVRVQAPELSWLRASGLFELDLLGPTGTVGSTISEGSFFVNPVLRVRHAYLKAETPIVDILFGQTWHLFGWQPGYVPAVVQWPGNVGNLFSRTTQLRISKTIKTKPVTVEFAVAGMRPPQRDSDFPEFEGGFRLSFNKWTAVHTLYMTSTATQAASIGISGDLRRFTLPVYEAMPTKTNSQMGYGVAVDVFLPIVRATKEHKDNSLSIIGEFVTGQGISDLYTGLTGGLTTPSVPAMAGMPAPTFNASVDPGLTFYDAAGTLILPTWTTFLVGVEYYLPKIGGRAGIFANYSRTYLHDTQTFGNPTKVRDNEMFCNAGFFVDPIEAIRLGVDYGRYDDTYVDGVHAVNHSVQVSGFLFF